MLASPKWAQIASIWNEKQKDDLVLVWHRLNGEKLTTLNVAHDLNSQIYMDFQDGLTQRKAYML